MSMHTVQLCGHATMSDQQSVNTGEGHRECQCTQFSCVVMLLCQISSQSTQVKVTVNVNTQLQLCGHATMSDQQSVNTGEGHRECQHTVAVVAAIHTRVTSPCMNM